MLTGPAAELEQGCCSYGAHFVDEDDEASTLAYAERLTPEQWQFHDAGHRKGGPDQDATRPARSRPASSTAPASSSTAPGSRAGSAAPSTRPPSRPASARSTGSPHVCWQLPLRLEDHTDEDGHVTSTLREWKRRDWGAGGFEFHWWCTDDPEAFVDREPVYVTMRDEIVEMVGPTGL